jgi:protein involved in polysaccharide export with SLBB domain
MVNRPGLVKWVPGKNVEYYIEKAGGFSWNARKGKIRLIKAQTSKWIKPKKNTPVEIGDTIFVPEKTEIDYWEMWKDILLIVSQIATIILVVQSVR